MIIRTKVYEDRHMPCFYGLNDIQISCDYQEEQEHNVIRDEMEKRAQLKRKWRISNVMAKSGM